MAIAYETDFVTTDIYSYKKINTSDCDLSTFNFIYLFLISGKVTTSIDLNLTELIHYDKGNVAV